MYSPEKEISCLFDKGKEEKSSQKSDSTDTTRYRQYNTKQDDQQWYEAEDLSQQGDIRCSFQMSVLCTNSHSLLYVIQSNSVLLLFYTCDQALSVNLPITLPDEVLSLSIFLFAWFQTTADLCTRPDEQCLPYTKKSGVFQSKHVFCRLLLTEY